MDVAYEDRYHELMVHHDSYLAGETSAVDRIISQLDRALALKYSVSLR